MQESILLFFNRIATPVLDRAASLISMLGEDALLTVFTVIIYWCVDKKKGLTIGVALITTDAATGIIKAAVKYPRPFQVLPFIKGKRLETATGYSFPSGHSSSAGSFYSCLAFIFKKRGLSIACTLIILLVGLSRLYLGVHWPLDVATGWILGISLSIVLTNTLLTLLEDQKKTFLFARVVGWTSGVLGTVFGILASIGVLDPVSFGDLCKTLGIACGAFLGFVLEEKTFGFCVDGTFREKFFRALIGVLTVLILRSFLKSVLPNNSFWGFFRYLLTGFWAFGCYPMLGIKIRLFQKA